jgi:hypothetical protein
VALVESRSSWQTPRRPDRAPSRRAGSGLQQRVIES